MNLKTAGLVGLATVALGAPASPQAKTTGDPGCPAVWTTAERMEALDQQIERLGSKLAALDAMLEAQTDARDEALSQAESRIQEAVHRGGLSPEQIDAAVARAIEEANVEAEVNARTSVALHKAMDAVRAQIEALDRRMHGMAEAPAAPAEPVRPEPPAAAQGLTGDRPAQEAPAALG